jgi:hypothetical protein
MQLHRIHVVDQQLTIDWMIRNTKIPTVVSNNHFMPDMPPFSRSVKQLIDVSIETERGNADPTSETEVSETLLERLETPQLGVGLPHTAVLAWAKAPLCAI